MHPKEGLEAENRNAQTWITHTVIPEARLEAIIQHVGKEEHTVKAGLTLEAHLKHIDIPSGT